MRTSYLHGGYHIGKRSIRKALVIVQPYVVRFGDISQPVDGIQHLRHTPLVLLEHGCQQIHGLGQGFVAFGELFEAFVDGHGVPGVDIIIAI